ncbi:hypothetical protein [Psychroflexus aestuariivivens]|uniref:hypothetical protein n=1 Tax=Psychroflexus aestuariivivens TaxID=1795040 RepID=UPI000FD89F62|nr:hypothetical protein [Psychroflexus aestuariivivens]
MTKILIIFLTLIFIPNENKNCTCAPIENWQKATPKEFEYVDDVFIGDVTISENQTDYLIVVCEVFKGDLKSGQKIKGVNIGYCGPFVDKNGEWVMFGKYLTEFKVNDCGLSSNIAEPYGMLPPPPPPPPDFKYDEKTVLKKWKAESKKMIIEQIKMLREISTSE